MKKDIKLRFEAPASALARWNPGVISASAVDETTINIYSTIGEYGDNQGISTKRVSDILAQAAGRPVKVNINSPGGDFFEGIAIHTLLTDYEGDVEVNVVGVAASAASVVAMAGTSINIAPSAFYMIHNSWTLAIGNKEDMRTVASMLENFDESMLSLYSAKTGIDKKKLAKMLGDETWINGEEAVSLGFASGLMGVEDVSVDKIAEARYTGSLKKVDVALAKAGMPRSERRNLIKDLVGTPEAAAGEETTPCAGDALVKALMGLRDTLTS